MKRVLSVSLSLFFLIGMFYAIGLVGAQAEVTPGFVRVELFNHSQNIRDDSAVDSVSAEGVGALQNYWDASSEEGKIGRGVSGDEWLVYKVKAPTNAVLQHVSFETFGTINGAAEVSADGKGTWTPLEAAPGEFFGKLNVFSFAKGAAPAMPVDGVLYVRLKSADGGKFYWQGFNITFYSFGEEAGKVLEPGETSGLINAEAEFRLGTADELSRLVDAGGTVPEDFFGQYNLRRLTADTEVLYYIDLPDGATAFSLVSICEASIRLSVSKDQTTWAPLTGRDGGGYFEFTGGDAILEDNSSKAFYLKVSAESAGFYASTNLKYTYQPLVKEEPPQNPEKEISFSCNTAAELDYLDPLHAGATSGKSRFANGENTLLYVFTLPETATTAELTCKIANEYRIAVSTDGESFTTLRQSLFRDFTSQLLGMETQKLQLSRFLTGEGEKTLYIRFSDPTTQDGSGPLLSQLTLSYTDDGRAPTEEQLEKEEIFLLPP